MARSGDEKDFVVIEIKAAIEQGKRVIPVLVGGASLPRPGSLPAEVRPLTERNAVALRPERFKADCQWLTSALRDSLAAAEQERAARTEAERTAAEIARQQEEAQAAARTKQVEAVRSARAAEGLSTLEVRKAEELANWNFVRDRKKILELRDHLARFPGGVTENYAMTAVDELVWASLGDKPAIPELKAYLEQFPNGEKAAEARARIADLEPTVQNKLSGQQASIQKKEQLASAAVVLGLLGFAASAFYSVTGLGTFGKIDITDTLHFFPFSSVLSSTILGFARRYFGRSSPRDALLAGVSYYLGATILQLFFVSVNQGIASNPVLLNFSVYLSSVLIILLALGVVKLLPELVRPPWNLAIALVLLPVVRAFSASTIVAAFGPMSTDAVRLVFAAAIAVYTGMLFAWIGYLMWRSQPRRPDEAD
jgi:hypothetical protein